VNCPVEGTVVVAPTASPAAGSYTSAQSVTLDATGETSIRYTTDGTTPTCSNTQYSSAISVGSSATIKAIACYANSVSSTVASFAYTITTSAATVTVSGGGGGGGGSAYVAPTTVTTVSIPTTIQPVPYVSPKTVAEMQANLTVLLQNLAIFQAQLKAMSVVPTASTVVPPAAIPSAGKFTMGLAIGDKNDDVRALQEFLKAQGPDVYPEGLVTGNFWSLTKKAVERFQEKYGIARPGDVGYGYVGPKTREKINTLLGL